LKEEGNKQLRAKNFQEASRIFS